MLINISTRSHLWRNFGVVIAWTVLYILVTAIASELFTFVASGGGALVFKKSAKKQPALANARSSDEEKAGNPGDSSASSQQTRTNSPNDDAILQSSANESILTWTNVNYSVPYQGGQRQLLTDVHGYAKAGIMVALMGVSGLRLKPCFGIYC